MKRTISIRHSSTLLAGIALGLWGCSDSDHSLGTKDVGQELGVSADQGKSNETVQGGASDTTGKDESSLEMSPTTTATTDGGTRPLNSQPNPEQNGTSADNPVTDNGSGVGASRTEILTAYCDREATCITGCGELPCDSEERRAACQDMPLTSEQGAECEQALLGWYWCMGQGSCPEVRDFFSAHPDGVNAETYCAAEYEQVTDHCDDFEPPEEYAFSGTAVSRVPVGNRCILQDESSPSFGGHGLDEISLEESAACGTGLCIAYHFQGRVSCPDGSEDSDCETPEGSPVTVPVPPQLASNPAEDHVFCTCRCSGGDGEEPACDCPGGTTCVDNVIEDLGLGGDLHGGYCIKDEALE